MSQDCSWNGNAYLAPAYMGGILCLHRRRPAFCGANLIRGLPRPAPLVLALRRLNTAIIITHLLFRCSSSLCDKREARNTKLAPLLTTRGWPRDCSTDVY